MQIGVATAWKTALEGLAVRSRAPDLYGSLSGLRGAILGYHNVVPDDYRGPGEHSLHLPLGRFREQLDRLLERHEFVPLDRILEASEEGGQSPIAITFDDAYRGALTLGVRELVARGIPATFFVTPGFVGGKPFWWDCIGSSRPGELPPEVRRKAIEELRGDDGRIRLWALQEGLRLAEVPEVARCGTVECLSRAASRPGITLAPHGWSHRNLVRLSARELEGELRRPMEWLTRRFAPVLPWLAHPYGHHDRMVEEAAARTGYHAALGIGTGILPRRIANLYALPRISVPSGLSPEGLLLRTSGLVRG